MSLKLVSVVLFLAFSLNAHSGTFDKVTLDTLNFGDDQSKCTAEIIIKHALAITGINFIQRKANSIWTCQKKSSNVDSIKQRCPAVQHMTADKYTCFSNASTINAIFVCVADGKSIDANEFYHGNKNPSNIARARFKSLHIYRHDSDSNRIQISWDMDSDGCTSIAGVINGPVNLKSCLKDLSNLANGKEIPHSKNKKKYCETNTWKDHSAITSHIKAIKDIGICLKIFPDLKEKYIKSVTPATIIPSDKNINVENSSTKR